MIFRLYLVGRFPAEQASEAVPASFSPPPPISLRRHRAGMKHPAVADCSNGIQTQWLHFSLSAKYLPIGECPLREAERDCGDGGWLGDWGIGGGAFEDKNTTRRKQPGGCVVVVVFQTAFVFCLFFFSLLCPGSVRCVKDYLAL